MKSLLKYFILGILFPAFLWAQWQQVSGSNGGLTSDLIVKGDTMFAVSGKKVFRSLNAGESWMLASSGITHRVNTLFLTNSNDLFAGTDSGGLFRSSNNGENWVSIGNELYDKTIYCLEKVEGYIFAGTDSNLYRSDDNGESWFSIPVGPKNYPIIFLKNVDDYLFAHYGFFREDSLLFRSQNNGDSWEDASSGLFILDGRNRITNVLTLITKTDSVLYGGASNRILRSFDNGLTWEFFNHFPITGSGSIVSFFKLDNDYYACDGVYLYRSVDEMETWDIITEGLPRSPYLLKQIYTLFVYGDDFWAGTIAGIFKSTDSGMNWKSFSNGLNTSIIRNIAVCGDTLIAISGNGYFIKYSTDGGENWITTADTAFYIYDQLVLNKSVLFISTYGPELSNNQSDFFQSFNLGEDVISLGWLGGNISYALTDTYLFAGYKYGVGGVKRIHLDSTVWIDVTHELEKYGSIISMGWFNSLVFAASKQEIYKSDNYGLNWNSIGGEFEDDIFVSRIVADEEDLIIATNIDQDFPENMPLGIFRYIEGEWNGINSGLTDLNIIDLVKQGSILFAATETQGVFVSTNNGDGWSPFNMGLPEDLSVNVLGINDTYVYAAAYGGVYRRPLAETVTKIDPIIISPKEFSLAQNYPNPFNPLTMINYQLAVSSVAELTIYNVIGQKVKTLVSEEQLAGTYQKEWNAVDFSSGVYYYQLKANGKVIETRKMILLK